MSVGGIGGVGGGRVSDAGDVDDAHGTAAAPSSSSSSSSSPPSSTTSTRRARTPRTAPGTTTPGTATPAAPRPPAPADPLARTTPVHFKGTATFPGPFQLTAAALREKYRGVAAKQFGTTDVELPGGAKNNVRDMHYDLGGGKVGMRFIPVSDDGNVTTAGGQSVPGHKVMDDFLRTEMGLGPNDPIFALIAYIHPEEHSGNLKQLATEMVKTEMGSTHMGAYVGNGRTTNSPEGYHNNEWEVKGYPANVQVVTLQGVDQATLNKNALLCDTVLNKNVVFPPDYKNDKYRTIDLNTTLMFYKDWIQGADYLKNDASWKTYCAEHKTIVANIMLNLPHNEASFQEVFGDAEGAAVWTSFKAKFQELNGRAFTAADETRFEPLWKKEGLTAAQVRPLTKTQYDAYEAARHAGTLATFTGPKPLEPGKGLAWPPETTADILNDFVETYASFPDVGGVVCSSMIMGFKDTIKPRMGITDQQYLERALPVMNKLMMADAMVNAARDPAWLQRKGGELYVAFGGKQEDLAHGATPNPQILGLAEQCLAAARAKLPEIVAAGAKRPLEAYAWLKDAMKGDLDAARKQAVSDPSKTEFYSPPAVSHRVSTGMHEGNRFVKIRTVCTAVDASEIQVRRGR